MTPTLPAVAASLLFTSGLFAQLPSLFIPSENPLTPAKVVLGKALFWDEQLSSDDTTACGTCHLPEFGGSDPRATAASHPGPDMVFGTADDSRGSRGVVRQDNLGDFARDPLFDTRIQSTRRTAPPAPMAAYHNEVFWDGRADTMFVDPENGQVAIAFGGSLESQAIGPILSDVEMAREGRTWQDVRAKLTAVRPLALARHLTPDLVGALSQHPTYPALFAAAFGDPAITARRIAFAIASYERTLIPDDTPWDRFVAGDPNALTPRQQNGWTLFQGNGRCMACHVPPLFTDDQFHILGLRPAREDNGRYGVTGNTFDFGAFKTPTLRLSGLRPRLFHNGSSPAMGTPGELNDPNSMINIYLNGGGVDRSNLDPFLLVLSNLGVTTQDLGDIQDFVRFGLTDARAELGLPPFDHPTLRSTAAMPPRAFGPELAGAAPVQLVDAIPTFAGNADWRLGISGGQGGGFAYLAYGLSSLEPAAWFGPLPIHLTAFDGRFVALGGAPHDVGLATWRVPIPNDPMLAAYPVFFQAFTLDASAPGGIATSRGLELRVQ
ncbi:MAG: hypothetical protein IPK26_14920 [Planctomycetes bacterium]|nr:hypothetical protein [Planctomycetota bacterium]